MGVLREVATGRRVPLVSRTLIGRTRRSDITITGGWVSGEHAVLFWSGSGWYVRDLGSRNGTTVDGRRVRLREERAVPRNAVLAFGQAEEQWVLEDAGPPVPMAIAANGALRLAVDEVLVLPDEEHAWAVVWQDEGRWFIRDANGQRTVLDRDTVVVGGESWSLRLPEPVERTGEGRSVRVAELSLQLTVSRDREFVDALLTHDGERIGLDPRSHHEVLLLLAEQHDEDARAGLEVGERGWIEAVELARMLGTDRDTLNVHVARIRKQVTQCGVLNGEGIIERRKPTGQLRLAPLAGLTIVRSDRVRGRAE